MFKRLGWLCGFCLLAVPSSAFAQNQDFVFLWSGPFGAGSATVSATNGGFGLFRITSMTNATQNGLAITLLGPGGYGPNDNLIFPAFPLALVDNNGFSFTDGTNGYNIFLPIQSIIDQTHAIPNTYYECNSATGSTCIGCPAPTCASPLAFFTITPLVIAVATLDPAPSLFVPSTSTITSDPSVLSSAGNPVTAIAADGVAQVVIRLSVNNPSFQPFVVLTDESGNVAPANGEDGTLSNLSGGTSNTPTVVLPAIQTINGQNYAFIAYNSPVDYARAAGQDNATASRKIAIEVTDGSGNILSFTQMNLLRPAVFFVHGLWGGPDTWDEFDASLKGSISGLKTYRADYKKHNGKSVKLNTPDVLTQAYSFFSAFRAGDNVLKLPVAAAQMDFIVHSMGGLISNTMPNYPLFNTPLSYGKGIIHKLITVDTPYQGSPLATNLGKATPACKTFFTKYVYDVDGAIEDLTPGSPFLQSFTIPSGLYYKHAIASFVIAAQAITAGKAVDDLTTTGAGGPPTAAECFDVFNAPPGNGPPDFSFSTYFLTPGDPYNGASDLIVSEASQLGLLIPGSAPQATTFIPGSTAHRTAGLAHSDFALPWIGGIPGCLNAGANPDIAFLLLNAPVSGSGINSFLH